MLHLKKSYPTLELGPRTLRPDFWGPLEPYYSKKNERTRQNHILMDKLAHISNGRQSESRFGEGGLVLEQNPVHFVCDRIGNDW